MKTLFCLLILASFAMAQPVWGPYVVFNSDSGYRIHDFQLAVHNDTCEVFISKAPNGQLPLRDNDAAVLRVPFYLMNGSSGTVSELVASNGWNQCIESVYADNSGHWAVAVFGFDDFNEETGYVLVNNFIQTSLFSGSGGLTNEQTLHADTLGRYECAMGRLGGQTISKSPTGYTLTSLFEGCKLFGDFGEPWAYAVVHQFNSQFSLDTTFDYCDESCAVQFGPQWVTGITQPDSLIVLMSGNLGHLGPSRIVTLDGSEQPIDYLLLCLPESESRPLFARTYSGLFLTVFENQIYEVEPTGGCTLLTEIPSVLDNASIAFHPSYGFAALQVHHARLFLARIDTTGTEVQPVGILHETDGEHFIVDADVTITDSGQVVAVWSEYTDWAEGPCDLKIAWTEWDIFLDTPEQGVPSVPRELTLSAYPNPFNSTVTISYELPTAGNVTLTAYDLQGRLVSTISDEFAPAGTHDLHWSPENLASGVYFLNLEAPLVHATQKILYLK